jgi:hypothetical protein
LIFIQQQQQQFNLRLGYSQDEDWQPSLRILIPGLEDYPTSVCFRARYNNRIEVRGNNGNTYYRSRAFGAATFGRLSRPFAGWELRQPPIRNVETKKFYDDT